MLETITLKFSESENLTIPASGITIFVGPNSSGKSLLLKEIEASMQNRKALQRTELLEDFSVKWLDVDALIERKTNSSIKGIEDPESERVLSGAADQKGNFRFSEYSQENVSSILKERDVQRYTANFIRPHTLRLDGRSRFELSNEQECADLLETPNTSFAFLAQENVSRERICNLITDALQKHLVIDPTKLGFLRLRLSDTALDFDELSLGAKAREFYFNASPIERCSDGLQAYVGILIAAFCGGSEVLLVDEPEAFLHPPLASKLGKQLTDLANERDGALFAATHSADFLIGCVQSAKSIRIVRLEHQNGKSAGRLVDNDELRALLTKPLMRSTNIISGLFFDGVVTTESDNDRVFYSEIYHRLREANPELPSVLFVNAQNKQTMRDILGPMRKFGVPVAAIPDIDFIKDGGSDATQWLTAAQIPSAEHIGLGQVRASLKNAFSQANKDMKTDGGIFALPEEDQEAGDNYLTKLAQYGIFLVPSGELENWLPKLSINGRKTTWVIDAMEKLGDDPSNAKYVYPSNDDVWQFISQVLSWISNTSRRGVR